MTRKSITTSHAVLACDVCGRTLLRGESADPFIAGGSRRLVCELCIARATNEGWIREGADHAPAARAGVRGGRSLLHRLRQRDRRPERRERLADEAPPETFAQDVYAAQPPVSEQDWPQDHAVEAGPAPVEAYEAPREPRHVHAVPTNADLKMARALDVFNSSRHPRTVSGVARSLGEPTVGVRASSSEGAIVIIVVGWELCWYRYEVDLADEAAGVRVTGQGDELSELPPEEQVVNAVADARGELSLAA